MLLPAVLLVVLIVLIVLIAPGVGLEAQLIEAMGVWLLLGVTAGLAVGLLRFVCSEDAAERSTSPGRSYLGGRARVVVELLGTGLTLGLLIGAAVRSTGGALLGFLALLAVALGIGVGIGIARDAW